MIRINLLPGGSQKRTLRKSDLSWLAILPWRTMGIVALGLLGFYSGVLLVSNRFNAWSLSRLNAQWDSLRVERSRLEQSQLALRALQNRAAVLKTLKSTEAQWAPRLNLLSDALVSKLWFTSLSFQPSYAIEEAASVTTLHKKRPAQKKSASKDKSASKKKATSERQKKVKASKDQVEEPKKTERNRPLLLLTGSALAASEGEGAPVSRYLHRLKEQPEFRRWFQGLELKSVEHGKIQQEEVSDFVIALYPKGL